MNSQFGITTYDDKTIKHPIFCVSDDWQLSTGISKIGWKSEMILFPNPSNEKITLKFNDDIVHLINIEIFNCLNENVLRKLDLKVKGSISLETISFKTGKYTFIINEGNLIFKKSFLIIH